jgi:hypothetical protein
MTTGNSIRQRSRSRSHIWEGGQSRIFRKTVELEVAKSIVRTFIRLWKMCDWTTWRGRTPLKRKKRWHTQHDP